MHQLANPTRFVKLADAILPWATGIAVIAFAIGIPMALVFSPPDYQQSETVRIMYVHVPSAWLGLFAYATMAISSAMFLIWKHPVADLIAQAAAPAGAAFTGLCLITGMLWGQPMWGTPWVWDARLTSMLILFFLYLGYMALGDAFDDPERGRKACAVLALVGSVNLPIVKFSVDWWNTLHQPASLSRLDIPAIDPAMLWPLLAMVVAFQAYFVALLLIRAKSELIGAKLQSARYQQASTVVPTAAPETP